MIAKNKFSGIFSAGKFDETIQSSNCCDYFDKSKQIPNAIPIRRCIKFNFY